MRPAEDLRPLTLLVQLVLRGRELEKHDAVGPTAFEDGLPLWEAGRLCPITPMTINTMPLVVNVRYLLTNCVLSLSFLSDLQPFRPPPSISELLQRRGSVRRVSPR